MLRAIMRPMPRELDGVLLNYIADLELMINDPKVIRKKNIL